MMVKQGNIALMLFYFLLATVCSTPILHKVPFYLAIMVLSIIVLITNVGELMKHRGLTISVLAYIIIAIAYRLIGISSANWGNYFNQVFFFLPALLVLLLPKKLTKKQQQTLWWFVCLVILFNIIDNIRISILYPYINDVSRLYLDEGFLSGINAGGIVFYTFSLFFFNICFFLFLNCKEKRTKKITLLASIITAIYIIVFCHKGSIVVYFLLSLVSQYFAYKTKNKKVFLIVMSIFALLYLFVVAFFKEEIVNLIVAISPSERLTIRLVTLIDEDNAMANVNTVTGRTSLYFLSVQTWLSSVKSFLFGIGDARALLHASETGIGQHADFLDTLARYGLMGLVILYSFVKNMSKYIMTQFDKKYNLQLLVIIFVFMMCGFTKNIFFPEIGFVLFFFLLLSRIMVNEYE